MNPVSQSPQSFYACPGPMTDPGPYAGVLAGLPANVRDLCQVVQGLMIHIFWAERYNVMLPEQRQMEVQIHEVAAKLERILAMDPAPLTQPRSLDRKLVGNCRDHSVLLASFFKAQGVPARARCGFGRYFMPDHFEDHWVVEYWDRAEARWVMVDAQIDALQREVLGIDFDTCDMPAGQFVPGGEAWLMCRRGEQDPDKFGIFDMHGLDFVRGNVLRDVAALNNVEMLPWDFWGLLNKAAADLTTDDLDLLDRVATLSLAGDAGFAELHGLYQTDERLRVPR